MSKPFCASKLKVQHGISSFSLFSTIRKFVDRIIIVVLIEIYQISLFIGLKNRRRQTLPHDLHITTPLRPSVLDKTN